MPLSHFCVCLLVFGHSLEAYRDGGDSPTSPWSRGPKDSTHPHLGELRGSILILLIPVAEDILSIRQSLLSGWATISSLFCFRFGSPRESRFVFVCLYSVWFFIVFELSFQESLCVL